MKHGNKYIQHVVVIFFIWLTNSHGRNTKMQIVIVSMYSDYMCLFMHMYAFMYAYIHTVVCMHI